MLISEAVQELLDKGHTASDIADSLGVSNGLISTWKNTDNDFCPRLPVAKKIYECYGLEVYPFSTNALQGIFK